MSAALDDDEEVMVVDDGAELDAAAGIADLRQRLEALRARRRLLGVAAGLGRWTAKAGGVLLLAVLCDWLVIWPVVESAGLSRAVRVLLDLAVLAGAVWALRQWVWPAWSSRPLDHELAVQVELAHPQLDARLVSTVQLAEHPSGSPDLVAALAEQTVDACAALDFRAVVSPRPARRMLSWALSVIAGLVLLGALFPGHARAAVSRLVLLGDAGYPTATWLIWLSDGARVPRGEPFTVELEVDAGSVIPVEAGVPVRLASGHVTTYAARRVEGATGPHGGALYRVVIDRVLEDFDFRAVAGDARFPVWRSVTCLQRPEVKALSITITPPAYLGGEPTTTTIGDLSLAAGSKVVINATFTRPVATALLTLRQGSATSAPTAIPLGDDARTGKAGFMVMQDGLWSLSLTGSDGTTNPEPIEHTITAIPDQAPVVRIIFPAADKSVTPFAAWPVRFSAHDDHDLSAAWLKYRVITADAAADAGSFDPADPTQQANVRALAISSVSQDRGTDVEKGVTFDLRQVPGLAPGQKVEYWIEASDNRQPVPNAGHSSRYQFVIIDAGTLEEQMNKDRHRILETLTDIKEQQEDAKTRTQDVIRELELRKPAAKP